MFAAVVSGVARMEQRSHCGIECAMFINALPALRSLRSPARSRSEELQILRSSQAQLLRTHSSCVLHPVQSSLKSSQHHDRGARGLLPCGRASALTSLLPGTGLEAPRALHVSLSVAEAFATSKRKAGHGPGAT